MPRALNMNELTEQKKNKFVPNSVWLGTGRHAEGGKVLRASVKHMLWSTMEKPRKMGKKTRG